MVLLAVIMGALLAADTSPPQYDTDVFKNDFAASPLIMNPSHPLQGRTELSFLASGSVVEKYATHVGGLLELSYNVLDSLALGASLGFFNGAPTAIVTEPGGILSNTMKGCVGASTPCGDITPQMPDYKEVTGVADLLAFWAPLYGKVSLFSEQDVALQLYGIAGGGINGTRVATAQALSNPQSVSDYQVGNTGFLQGGFFDNSKVHATFGAGMRIFFADAWALRFDVRTLMFRDTFTFVAANGPADYWSAYWFGQGGLAWNF